MGHVTNEFEVCSCGLRLHGKSIDKAVGHLDAQLQPIKLFIRNLEFDYFQVVSQEYGVLESRELGVRLQKQALRAILLTSCKIRGEPWTSINVLKQFQMP